MHVGVVGTSLTLALNLSLPLLADTDLVVALPAEIAPWDSGDGLGASVRVVAASAGGFYAEAGSTAAFNVSTREPLSDFEYLNDGGTVLHITRPAGASEIAANSELRLTLGAVLTPDFVSLLTLTLFSRLPGATAVGVAEVAALGDALAAAAAASELGAAAAAATYSTVTSDGQLVRDAASLVVVLRANIAPTVPALVSLTAEAAATGSAVVLPMLAGEPVAVRLAFAHAGPIDAYGYLWLALPAGFSAVSKSSVLVRDALADDLLAADGSAHADAVAAWQALYEARALAGNPALGLPASLPSVVPLDGVLSVDAVVYTYGYGDLASRSDDIENEGTDGFSQADVTFRTLDSCNTVRSLEVSSYVDAELLSFVDAQAFLGPCRLVVRVLRQGGADLSATPMLPGDAHALVISGLSAPAKAGQFTDVIVVTATGDGFAVNSGAGVSNGTLVVLPNVLSLATLAATSAETLAESAGASPLAAVAGAQAVVQFAFRMTNPLPETGGLRITLPNGFGVSNYTSAGLVTAASSPTKLQVDTNGDAIIVDISAFSIGTTYQRITGELEVDAVIDTALSLSATLDAAAAALAAVSLSAEGAFGGVVVEVARAGIAAAVVKGRWAILTLTGLTLPTFAHTACCAAVATVTAGGSLIDVSLPLEPIVITPGPLLVEKAALSTSLAGAATDLLFQVRLSNPLPPNGTLRLELDALLDVSDELVVLAALLSDQETYLNLSDSTVALNISYMYSTPNVTSFDANALVTYSLGKHLDLAIVDGLGPGVGIGHGARLLLLLRGGLTLPPYSAEPLSNFGFSTLFNAGVGPTVDEAEAGLLELAVEPNKLYAALSLDERRVGSLSELTISFVLSNEMPADGQLDVYLPATFSALGSTRVVSAVTSASDACTLFVHRDARSCPAIGTVTAARTATISASARLAADGSTALIRIAIRCALAPSRADYASCALAPSTAYSITVLQLTNPQAAAVFSAALVELLDGQGRTVDTATATGAQPNLALEIKPNLLLNVKIVLDDDRAGEVTSLSVEFETTNPITSDGSIRLAFPKGFLFVGPSTGFDFGGTMRVVSSEGSGLSKISGNLVVSREGGDAALAKDDSVLVLARGNGAATIAGERHRLEVEFVQNPLSAQTTGTFYLSTRTASLQLIDINEVALQLSVAEPAAGSSSSDSSNTADGKIRDGELVVSALPAVGLILGAALSCLALCVVCYHRKRILLYAGRGGPLGVRIVGSRRGGKKAGKKGGRSPRASGRESESFSIRDSGSERGPATWEEPNSFRDSYRGSESGSYRGGSYRDSYQGGSSRDNAHRSREGSHSPRRERTLA